MYIQISKMIATSRLNGSKLHLPVLFRQTTPNSMIINCINHKYIHSSKNVYRKTLQEYKVEETKKVRFYILHTFANFLSKYPETLNKRFPKAMHMYRLFTAGVQDIFKDVKDYIKIVRILYNKDFDYTKLTRKELELYVQVPKDMRKIAPVLLISVLPFAYYVILPLIYYYPRQLLTSHFWNLQQKSEFSLLYLKSRLSHNKPVFRSLQEQLDFLKHHRLHNQWSVILGMLGSGVQPTAEQILECKELFHGEPYNLEYLRPRHIRHLLKMHDMHLGWFRRRRLAERAILLKEMDKAIIREGGVHNLSLEALSHVCYMRGLNPTNMKQEDMIKWMKQWIQISSNVDDDTLSLLLHTPVLLGYNQPSNWMLIYK